MAQDNPYAKYVTGGTAAPILGPAPRPAPAPAPPTPFQQEDQDWQRTDQRRKDLEWQASHNPDGSLKPKDGGDGSLDPKTQDGQKNLARNALKGAGVDFTTGKDPVADLILGSTSGKLQHFGADLYGSVTGDATDGMEKISRLSTIGNDMVLSMSGGSLGAQISNSDRDFMAARFGDIANPDLPASARLAAWQQVRGRLATIGGVDQSGPGFGSIPAAPPPADPASGGNGGGTPGGDPNRGEIAFAPTAWDNAAAAESTGNPQQVAQGKTAFQPDNAVSNELWGMWKAGKSRDEIAAYASAKGYDLPPVWPKDTFEQAKRDPRYNPFRVGKYIPVSMRGQYAGGATGAYASGATNALTAGFSDEIYGVANAAVGRDYTASRDSFNGAKQAMADSHPIADIAGNLTGGAMLGPVAGRIGGAVAPNATRAVTTLAEANPIKTAAAYGGAYGAGENNDNRLAGAVIGTVAGAGGGALGTKVINPALKKVGNALARPSTAAPVTNALDSEAVAIGASLGGRTMTTDVRPPRTAIGKLARTIGEKIPFAGTAGPRAAQQVERQNAVKQLLTEGGADAGAVDAISADLVATRGAAIQRLTASKKLVIESIDGAVSAPRAVAAIDQQIAKLSGIDAEAYAPIIKRLGSFKNALSSGKTLEQVEGQRKLLGDLFNDPSLAAIRGDGQKALNAIYKPLREDMGDYIEAQAGKAARARWSNANDQLAGMAGELKSGAFKGLLNNAETTPEAAAKIVFGSTPSDMRRLLGSLSDGGKLKVQAAILHRAAEKSMDGDIISPQKFATAIDAMKKSTGVFLNDADRVRLEGAVRWLKGTQHASVAGASPMTGAQNTPLLFGASLTTLFGGKTIPVAGLIGLTARGYESKLVRDAFMRLGRTRAGSPQEATVVKKLSDAFVRSGVVRSAMNDNPLLRSPGAAAAQDEGDTRRKPPAQ